VSRLRRILRIGLPFAVSGGLLFWLLARFDFRAVMAELSLDVVAVLLPALALYGAVSLYLEAQSLVRVFASSAQPIDLWTGARVRAASYLFQLFHNLLGAGVMAVLLRRRTGLSLADAGGAVAFVSALDLGVMLVLGTIVLVDEPLSRVGLSLLAIGGIAGGLTLLRSSVDLGPLESLRALALFRAPRTTPLRPLLELVVLRITFVASFVGIAASALLAFDVHVPLAPLITGVVGVAVVAALPIALAGLGTGQAAFVYLFRDYADPETLLACSLALSAGLLALRGALGLFFARELTQEALEAAREIEV
jgi:uncharacterized membrane protein YbhN (UPF0104 family)